MDGLIGNSAANTLYGGSGTGVADLFLGGGGADIFVCSVSDANTNLSTADTIFDFVDGTDLIGLEDLTFSDLGIVDNLGDTVIFEESSDKILFVLDSISYSLIDASDFISTDFV